MRFILIIVFAIFFNINCKKISDSSKNPIRNGQIIFPPELIPLQANCFEIEGKNYFFVAFYIDRKDFNKKITYPVRIYSINEDGSLRKEFLSFGSAEHIRHFSKITTPWGEGIIFADHGVDEPSLNIGGKVLLIVKNSKTQQFEDMSSRLNLGNNYSFNIVTPKRKNNLFNDILIVPFNTLISRPIYLQARDDKYINSSDLLPVDWRNKNVCFMTGTLIDFEKDGSDDVFLGGCDEDGQYVTTTRDRILSWNGKKWEWNLKSALPLRKKEYGWGTVFLTSADLNHSGQNDIIALTHDWGFRQGAAQILLRDKDQDKISFRNTEILNWPTELLKSHHYLHEVTSYDINNDGYLDLIAQIRYIDKNYVLVPNIIVLLNKINHWEYKRDVFNLSKTNHILSVNKVKFKNKNKESLVFIFYNGDFVIF